MKKAFLMAFCIFSLFTKSEAQKVSVANIKLNVLYLGVDNPISVAVENVPCSLLVVKTSNGTITGNNCSYTIHPSQIGPANVIMYKNYKGKLMEIARSSFRVKRLPELPVFKIGTGRRLVTRSELAQQEFVRVELDNIDLDTTFPVEQFTVQIISKDSGRSMTNTNIGYRLNEEIKQAFNLLKPNDEVIFKNILIQLGTENHVEIEPRKISIIE